MPASGAIPGESSPLYFQPGIGWQRAPQAAFGPGARAGESSMADKKTTKMNFGAEDWVKANSALNPANSLAFSRLKTGVSPIPYSAASFSQHAESDDSLGAAQELGSHAYVSTIKLRKMMRSASDFETRLELEKISAKVAGKHDKATDSYEKSKAREENLKAEGSPGKVNHTHRSR